MAGVRPSRLEGCKELNGEDGQRVGSKRTDDRVRSSLDGKRLGSRHNECFIGTLITPEMKLLSHKMEIGPTWQVIVSLSSLTEKERIIGCWDLLGASLKKLTARQVILAKWLKFVCL